MVALRGLEPTSVTQASLTVCLVYHQKLELVAALPSQTHVHLWHQRNHWIPD